MTTLADQGRDCPGAFRSKNFGVTRKAVLKRNQGAFTVKAHAVLSDRDAASFYQRGEHGLKAGGAFDVVDEDIVVFFPY